MQLAHMPGVGDDEATPDDGFGPVDRHVDLQGVGGLEHHGPRADRLGGGVNYPGPRRRLGYRRGLGLCPGLGRRATAVALGVEFQDGGMVDEPIDGRDRHGRIGEDLIPVLNGWLHVVISERRS